MLAHIDQTGVIFLDKRFAEKFWTHDIEALVKAADLEVTRGLDISTNPELGVNWSIVKDWSEIARHLQKAEAQARLLFEAVSDPANGVPPWIKIHW